MRLLARYGSRAWGAARTRSRTACLLVLATSAACSASPRTRPADGPSAYVASGPGAAIELTKLEGGAPLAVVRRDGDPRAGAALAVFAPGDPAALVGLAEVIRKRTEAAGLTVDVRVELDAAFFSFDASAGAAAVRAIRQATSSAIGPMPELREPLAAKLESARRPLDAARVATRACLGQLGLDAKATLDPASAEGAARMERLRASMRIAFGVVGDAGRVDGTVEALGGAGPWPAGADAPSTPVVPAASAATSAELGARGVRLTVAVRVSSAAAAVAGASRVAAYPSALEARGLTLDPPLSLTRAVGVARPDGGCVAVTLAFDGAARGDATRAVASAPAAARAIGDLVAREVERETEPGAAARAVASTGDPLEAAALAAWWALAGDDPRGAPTRVVSAALELGTELELPREGAEAGLARILGEPSPIEPPKSFRARIEQGQGELFVLVANPCVSATEPAHRWGAGAMAALAAESRLESDPSPTSLEAFIDPRGVGFLAHASARPGESAGALAERVADAAASAFFTPEARADELLHAQETALSGLEARWGRGAIGLLALGQSAGPRAATLEPLGPPELAQRFEAVDLALRLRSLARGPLTIAVLANQDEQQARTAAAAAARWFSPEATAPSACPVSPREPLEPRVDARGARGPARAHVVVLSEPGRSTEVAAELLGGPDGLVTSALRAIPGADANARATPDGGALVIEVRAPEDGIERAVGDVRDLLSRVSRGEVPDAAIVAALARREARERARLAEPRERVVRVWAGDDAVVVPPIAPAEVRAWLGRTLVAERTTVAVAHSD